MEEDNNLFKEADDWVYSSDTITGYDRPDEELYEYLVPKIGDIMILMNIAYSWGYTIPTRILDKFMMAWYGYQDHSPLRPPYAAIIKENLAMNEDRYMLHTIGRDYIPVFMHPETNRNRSYVESLEPLFGDPSSAYIKEQWKTYVDDLPREISLQWNIDRGITTPINEMIASTRFEFLDALLSGPWAQDSTHIILDDSFTDAIEDNARAIYPDLDTLTPYIKVAMDAAAHRPNPDTTNASAKIAIIIYIIYDALGASDDLLDPLKMIIYSHVMIDGTNDHINAFVDAYGPLIPSAPYV